jgi:hypothetical protein
VRKEKVVGLEQKPTAFALLGNGVEQLVDARALS